MPLSETWFFDRLKKKADKGPRGYPVATVVFYGPTDKLASKVAVGIIMADGEDAEVLERWYSPDQDARKNPQILRTILQLLEQHGVKTIAMPDRLLGCPHEEGKDYPEGESCPQCPYWRDKDRFSGRVQGSAGEAY